MGTLLFFASLIIFLAGAAASVFQSRQASQNKEHKLVIKPFAAIGGTVVAGFLFALYLGVYSVDAGSVGVEKRFGNPVTTLQPGLHFVCPIGCTVTEVPTQTRIVKTSEGASSRDLQLVNAEVTLGYHVDPQNAMDILVKLNNDAETRVIVPAILESIKAETAQYDVQQLITDRAKVRDGIEDRVKTRLLPYHIVAETVSITSFSFSAEYERAIEAKQVAEQSAEKAKNVLEQTKIEAQQQAAKAQGEADSQLIVAKAKAEAQRLQRENITPELIQMRTIELMHDKWDGVFPSTYIGGGANPTSLLIQPPHTAAKAN